MMVGCGSERLAFLVHVNRRVLLKHYGIYMSITVSSGAFSVSPGCASMLGLCIVCKVMETTQPRKANTHSRFPSSAGYRIPYSDRTTQ